LMMDVYFALSLMKQPPRLITWHVFKCSKVANRLPPL